ncbi:MAG: hypothetical protein AB1481_06620 [Candidatus Omnitrophota bacterium]
MISDFGQKRTKHWVAPLFLFLLALALRIYKAGPECYYNGDALILPSLVSFSKNPAWVFFHSYGIITPIISEVFTNILVFSGITINEFWWIFPFGVAGTSAIAIIYFLIREIAGYKAAVFVTVVMALNPADIILCRYSYGYECVSFFLAILSLYLFILYLRNPVKLYGILLSIALSCYILSHVFFIIILAVFLWAANIFYPRKSEGAPFTRELKNIFSRKEFIFPLISVLFLLFQFAFYMSALKIFKYDLANSAQLISFGREVCADFRHQFQTPLAHYLLRAGSLGRDFFAQARDEFFKYYGFWPLVTLCIIPFGVKDALKFNKRSIFFLWGIIYIIPYYLIDLFNVSRPVVYFNFGFTPFLIYFSLLLYDSIVYINKKYKENNLLKILYSGLILCIFIFLTLPEFNFLRIKEDSGVKAMGYYMRNYVKEGFFIYSASSYLNDPMFCYYFGRGVSRGNFLSSEELIKKDFENNLNNVEVIITEAKKKDYFDSFSGFEIKARVFKISGKNEQDLMLLYARRQINLPFKDMNVEEYNKLFDNILTGIIKK